MFAVGHLALGYLSGKISNRLLDHKLDIPLLFVLSVLPDIDLLIPGLQHRGLTHSIVFISVLSLPAFLLFREKAVPYFVALIQHPLLGDFLAGGGIQLLWPVTSEWYGLGISIRSLTSISAEWTLFLACLAIMFKTRDAWILLQRHSSNLLLSIPIFTVLLPTLLSFPISVPLALLAPHLVYLTMFALSLLVDFRGIFRKI
jgi:membrane-bound metal-dependent hydrolase YbcI (DUF457 family)